MGDEDASAHSPVAVQCRNCGAPLTGTYCAACGQRDLAASEIQFSHLVRDAISGLTNLDSRFWRTFIALIFRPGRLSRDYIDGRRAYWLAPVTVFLLVNVFYFFAPALSDFILPFEDQVPGHIALQAYENPEELSPAYREYLENWRGQFHSPLTAPLVERRVAERHARLQAQSEGESSYTFADYRRAYERVNADVSNLLIGLHIPFLAVVPMALFWRSRLYYAEHFVMALHLFSFVVLLQQILIGPLGIVARYWGGEGFGTIGAVAIPLSIGLAFISFIVALRRVYRSPWWWSVMATALFVLSLGIVHLLIFRPVQFLTIFALT